MTTKKMSRQEILHYVLQSDDLPTLPIVAAKLITIIDQEETTLTDIANLISIDMALSTRILKVVNSSFYSFTQKISSINQAVSILGTKAVYSLVLSFSFLSMDKSENKTSFNFEEFWEQSLAGAVAAKLILQQIPDANIEDIFTPALLRDIGKLVQAFTLPELYYQEPDCLQKNDEEQEITLEKEITDTLHCDIGYAVTEHWGFPNSLLLPIKYHGNPEEYTGGNEEISLSINIVYLSTLITRIIYSDKPEKCHKLFKSEAKRLLHMKVLPINKILNDVHSKITESAEDFGLNISSIKSVEEIIQEANIKLTLLNLSYEEINRELIQAKMQVEETNRELEFKNKLLKDMANIDGLTKIYNHRYFQNFLDKEINRSIHNQSTLSILLADLDNFKNFNDSYGHQTGDFILKEFCRVCKENIRKYDLIARYGGEEFVFILPDTEPDNARIVAEKIRSIVENYSFTDGDSVYQVTVSIGVASTRPVKQSFKKNEFIGLADEALYQAKREGRNRVAMYKPDTKKKWFNF